MSDKPMFSVNDQTAVLDDDFKPIDARVGPDRAARPPRPHPARLLQRSGEDGAHVPEIDGVRWVLPGDMAKVDADGTVVLLGRGSVSINSGGEKIYPEEVEAALKAHPDVFDAVVVGTPDERWGEKVTAVVQVREGTPARPSRTSRSSAATASPATRCRVRLPSSTEMVRSPSGKADYRWAKEYAS